MQDYIWYKQATCKDRIKTVNVFVNEPPDTDQTQLENAYCNPNSHNQNNLIWIFPFTLTLSFLFIFILSKTLTYFENKSKRKIDNV